MSERPFRFALESVRKLRAGDEQAAKAALAVSIGDRMQGEAALQSCAQRTQSARRSAAPQPGAVVPAALLVGAQAWLERSEAAQRDAAERLRAADAVLEQRRAELATAAQRREVFDRLRERRLAEHRQEAARIESAALDEIALAVHRRRSAA